MAQGIFDEHDETRNENAAHVNMLPRSDPPNMCEKDAQVIGQALKIAREVIVETWPESGADETYLAQARLEAVDAACALLPKIPF